MVAAGRRAQKPDLGISEEQEKFLIDAAGGLMRFATGGYFPRGTFTDVVTWVVANDARYSRAKFAFVGNAVKVANVFGMERGGASNVKGKYVDHWLKNALHGIPASWDHGLQHSGDSVQISEFLDYLGNYLGKAFEGVYDEAFTEYGFTVIIEPGYPWSPDLAKVRSIVERRPATQWYYSAKQEKFVEPERPGWLIGVEPEHPTDGFDKSEPLEGVNPCVVFPSDESKTQPGPVFGAFDDGTEMMVAHSMTLLSTDKETGSHKQIDNAIDGIKSCGGLLFPSLSVGPIPATNFGPIVLVGRLELVTASLKPYKERGRNPSWVYDTDTWTVGTRELMRTVAIKLFEEFHGHEDWVYGRMWALGPPADAGSAPGRTESIPLKTTSQLKRAIKKRMKFWRRDMTPEQFHETSEECAGTECSYGYCEAKAREVVSLDEFPYIITPLSFEDDVERFVRGTGYKGEVKVLRSEVDDIAELIAEGSANSDLEKEVAYRWSWEVSDAVRKLAPVARVIE